MFPGRCARCGPGYPPALMTDNSTANGDAPLRDDIRRLGRMLGETLVRQEGPELAGLVEEIRVLAREVRRGSAPEDAARLDEMLLQKW